MEMEDLNLNPSQRLQILGRRTIGKAYYIVDHTKYLELELSPSAAIANAWRQLDARFGSPYLQSQTLLHDLINGPIISHMYHDSLCDFAQKCTITLRIQQTNPRSLPSLEEPII